MMTPNQYIKFLEEQNEALLEMAKKKAADYATDSDIFVTFKRAASLLGCTEEQYLYALVTKHLLSISKAINEDTPLNELMEDRAMDVINYHFLLIAMKKQKALEKTKNQEENT